MGGMGLKMIPMLVRHFLARPVWALGHSNWIISFPLTAHIPTWHPHIFYVIENLFIAICILT